MQGLVKFFNVERGFGFVHNEAGSWWFHRIWRVPLFQALDSESRVVRISRTNIRHPKTLAGRCAEPTGQG
jgi:hypothetical protein